MAQKLPSEPPWSVTGSSGSRPGPPGPRPTVRAIVETPYVIDESPRGHVVKVASLDADGGVTFSYIHVRQGALVTFMTHLAAFLGGAAAMYLFGAYTNYRSWRG